jgi:hypothetical protein
MEGEKLMIDWQDKIIFVGMIIIMIIAALNIDSFMVMQ